MKLFGLIGYPLSHSFSKKYFTDKFHNGDIDAQYELYELKQINEFLSLKTNLNLFGLNVTIPYKQQIIPFLDELDEIAVEIGAVNVIKFIRENDVLRLKGFNTDAIGFEQSIKPHLKSYHQKALILGTGGASRAIDFSLQKLGLSTIFVSRTPEIAQFGYTDLNEKVLSEYLVIINATPVGTFPRVDESPDIPYEYLTSKHLLFDAVYNPAETVFLKKGRANGTDGMNGEEMLIRQAEAAWKIWNDL